MAPARASKSTMQATAIFAAGHPQISAPAAIKLASLDSGHWPGSPSDARQMTMDAVYRRAMRKDASRLYDIRRRSILELAPPTMPAAEARA